MRAFPALLLPLLVAGAVGYLLWRSEPAAPTAAIERPAEAPDAEPPQPVVLHGRGDARSADDVPDDVADDAAGHGEDVDAEAPATRRLEGLVTDERDVPIAGVRLEVGPSLLYTSQAWVLTAGDGAFDLPAFPVGEAGLRVLPGDGWVAVPLVPIRPDQRRVHVRLQRAASLRIRVLDAAGRPAAGVRFEVVDVRLGGDGTHSLGGRPAGLLDHAGETVVGGLPPGGRIELHVGGGEVPDVRFRDVAVTADDRVLRLPPPVVLAGVLVDEEGRPLGGVSMWADGCEPHVWHVRQATETEVTTGRFRFDGLAPGRYRLDVDAPTGYSERHEPRFVHAPRTDLRVQLARLVRASGTVWADDPTQVAVLWCAGGARMNRTPAADGTFVYEGLPNIPGTLYACHEVSGDAALLVGVRPDEGPFAIRLQPAATIRGSVPELPPARHPHVLLGAKRGPLLIEGELHPDRTFSIRGVPPGAWTIELWDDGGCVRVEGVEAGATDVVVPLPPPADPGGR